MEKLKGTCFERCIPSLWRIQIPSCGPRGEKNATESEKEPSAQFCCFGAVKGARKPLSCCRTRREVPNDVPESGGFLPEWNALTMLFRLHKIVHLCPRGGGVHPGKLSSTRLSQWWRAEVFFGETRKWKETLEHTFSDCQLQVRNQGQLSQNKCSKGNLMKRKGL